MRTTNKLTAVWLQPNQCWTVLFGDSVVGIGTENKRLFASLDELDNYLLDCGLVLNRIDKTIESKVS